MSSYIQNLRMLVGAVPIVAATASVIVLDAAGRLLLQRRSDDGTWGLPGGYVELGESVPTGPRSPPRFATRLRKFDRRCTCITSWCQRPGPPRS